MAIFIIHFDHPDEAGWQLQLMPHIHFLQDLLAEGVLLASGPHPDADVKSAMLLIKAADETAARAIIDRDPFAEHGLMANMTVTRWDPIFGVFNDLSSMPGAMQSR